MAKKTNNESAYQKLKRAPSYLKWGNRRLSDKFGYTLRELTQARVKLNDY